VDDRSIVSYPMGRPAALTANSQATSRQGQVRPASRATGSTSGSGDLSEVPDETGGPYPGDGSNGPNVLDDSGVVRGDIRSSFGSSTTTAEGVPLDIKLTVRDAASGDVLTGAGVYLWHCDREGRYSLYSEGVTGENYLRGAQQVDAAGTASFTSIFPACYAGRWPHIHFEVYASLSDATSSGPIVKTSQIALPKEACEAVYATAGYEQSVANLSQVSLTGDNVFGDDGGIHQIATMSGDATGGYTAALTIGV
jgi:protocatechuate 3,4-dioxygenase beta subunit